LHGLPPAGGGLHFCVFVRDAERHRPSQGTAESDHHHIERKWVERVVARRETPAGAYAGSGQRLAAAYLAAAFQDQILDTQLLANRFARFDSRDDVCVPRAAGKLPRADLSDFGHASGPLRDHYNRHAAVQYGRYCVDHGGFGRGPDDLRDGELVISPDLRLARGMGATWGES